MKTTRKCFASTGLAIALALMSGSSLCAVPVFTSLSPATITVTSQSTAGTASTIGTAWALNETMTGAGTVSITDTDGVPLGTLTPYASGSWITKTVLNNSGVTWTSFEMELQEILGTPSPDGDGLSFAQGAGLVFSSNKFTTITRIDTTRDYLNFSGGSVLPGTSVSFTFAVTDNSPQSPVFLQQTPNKVDVVPDAGSAGLLFFVGLTGLVGLRKKLR
jgi:hypothetical protein